MYQNKTPLFCPHIHVADCNLNSTQKKYATRKETLCVYPFLNGIIGDKLVKNTSRLISLILVLLLFISHFLHSDFALYLYKKIILTPTSIFLLILNRDGKLNDLAHCWGIIDNLGVHFSCNQLWGPLKANLMLL